MGILAEIGAELRRLVKGIEDGAENNNLDDVSDANLAVFFQRIPLLDGIRSAVGLLVRGLAAPASILARVWDTTNSALVVIQSAAAEGPLPTEDPEDLVPHAVATVGIIAAISNVADLVASGAETVSADFTVPAGEEWQPTWHQRIALEDQVGGTVNCELRVLSPAGTVYIGQANTLIAQSLDNSGRDFGTERSAEVDTPDAMANAAPVEIWWPPGSVFQMRTTVDIETTTALTWDGLMHRRRVVA